MMPTFASHLDALGQWRADTDARLAALARFAREHDLLDDASANGLRPCVIACQAKNSWWRLSRSSRVASPN